MSKKKVKKNLSFKEQIKPIFKERFLEMLRSEEEYKKFEKIILTPQRKSFRINTLKCKDSNKILKNFAEKGIKTIKIPWCDNAYFIDYVNEKFNNNIDNNNSDNSNNNKNNIINNEINKQIQRTDLGNLFEHFLGKIYIQEATSMTPPELLEIPNDISDDFKVLDMASSPGSKTTQLGTYMNNNGILVANELDFKRLGPLKINLERSGLNNIIIINLDGTKIEGEEIYDRILLDAPCSGSGVIRKSPKTIRTYNPKQLKSISKLQLKLFQRAFDLLKIGGIMTYSTCSLDPEENEFVVDDFLKKNPNAVLENSRLNGLILNNSLSEFKGRIIPKEITEKTMRIWPQDNNTNGFFVAKIRKI